MAVSTKIKVGLNVLLRPLNVRFDTWTAADTERNRLEALRVRGCFDQPCYPLSKGMERFDGVLLSQAYATHRDEVVRLSDPSRCRTGYDPRNGFFKTPDAEVLYLLIRSLRPRRIIEVGCGNSTRIARAAITHGAFATELIAIDPAPRVDIAGLVDQFEQRRLEEIEDHWISERLGRDDILFIDSSHQVDVGNDVARLFCKVMPSLKQGVVVHVHDVFLPYEYPASLAFEYPHWGEQYLLQTLLHNRDCEVLWPGHHVQRDRPDLHSKLPFVRQGRAQSFWFRWS